MSIILKLSTVVGAIGLPMEPAAKLVEEAPRPEAGEFLLQAQLGLLSGLARVQHHPVVAQPVLEALPKTPTATPSAVVSHHDFAIFATKKNLQKANTISHTHHLQHSVLQ